MASLPVSASTALSPFTVGDIDGHPDNIPAGTLFVKYKGQPKIFICHSEDAESARAKKRNEQLDWCEKNIPNNFRKLRCARRGGFVLKSIRAIDVVRCMCQHKLSSEQRLRSSYFENGGRDHYSDIIQCLEKLYPKTCKTHIFPFIGYSEQKECFVWTVVHSPALWHICLDTVAIANVATMLRVIATGNILDTIPEEVTRLSVDRFSVASPLPRVTNLQMLFRYAGKQMKKGDGECEETGARLDKQSCTKKKQSKRTKPVSTPTKDCSQELQTFPIFQSRSKQSKEIESTEKNVVSPSIEVSNATPETQGECEDPKLHSPRKTPEKAITSLESNNTIEASLTTEAESDTGSGTESDSATDDDEDDLMLDSDEEDREMRSGQESMDFAYSPIDEHEDVCGIKISPEKLFTSCLVVNARESSKSYGSGTADVANQNVEYARSLKVEAAIISERMRFLKDAMRSLKRRYSMMQRESLALQHMEEQLQTECDDLYSHVESLNAKTSRQEGPMLKKRHIDETSLMKKNLNAVTNPLHVTQQIV